MTKRIVVLGAGYAGLGAAKRAARRLRGTDAQVTLVNASDRFVERVRLHQLAAGQSLPDLPLSTLLDGTGVDLAVARVTGIDLGAHVVRLDAVPYELTYDVLIYALGSGADLDVVPGTAEHAFTLATAGEATRLRSRLAEARSVAVVGGGLTGIEAATEIAEAYPRLDVRLISGGRIGNGLSDRPRRHLHKAFARLGVAVREHTPVAKIGPDGLLLDDGREVSADTVVWAAGFRVPGLAAACGLATDEDGRMLVDATLRSLSHPEVFGVGDAAAARTPGGRSRMSCQTGLPMGLQAGAAVADLLAGRKPRPARIRYVWQNISLGRRDGVTQFTHADDSPLGVVLTGRASALFKEAITRSTVWRMRHPGP
ncbi:NAD(P)/FAD-dependent oxidoreductase [Nonomuraea rhodomycinica]|uniref:FAD-dependent oxidoreductase n=1 Tax=Nonomuraea rhodomycinica TaxID=1712872 RepID=A0A7Y6IK85_9ACTN|nr:FAD-dependent oxidoreductase [Nonomuraea rhodomycinica]NUW39561.1 FAD-dependent oxidoreductase [Nonomuraea rhodomycinica]